MDKGFSEEFKEKLKASNDIVSTISRYATLQKKGKNWWACCPFHFEKTPSFSINEYEQYYHCFGCGASGDVITFIEKIENVDFYDACKILADKAGIEMPAYSNDETIAKQKKVKERLYLLLKDAAMYYYNNLKSPSGKLGLDYLEKRKISNKTITLFGLGYSLGWDEVIKYLTNKGYTLEEMVQAGVAECKNGKYFDAFAKRLMFPIINTFGNVTGFSARVLEKSDFGKYKNTTQTLVFDKGRTLYGLNMVKKYKSINPINEIIIVEGQIDLISMYQAGVTNAVATMGTALTNNHAKELKRFSDKVVLCFDGDGAGVKATLRSIEILVKEGMQVYVAFIPNNQDPDEYIQANGKEAFQQIINSSKYWVEYLLNKYLKDYDITKPEQKSSYILECLNVISSLQSSSEQDIYLTMLSKMSGVSKQVLVNDLNRAPQDTKNDNQEIEVANKTSQVDLKKENAYVKAMRFVMWAILHKEKYASFDADVKSNILNSDYLKIYEYAEAKQKANESIVMSVLFDMFDVESNTDISELIGYEPNPNEQNDKYYADCVKTIINSGVSIQQNELLDRLKKCTDAQEKKQILVQLNTLIKSKK